MTLTERFKNWSGNPFNLCPRSGYCNKGHRCAGELVTVEVMDSLLHLCFQSNLKQDLL